MKRLFFILNLIVWFSAVSFAQQPDAVLCKPWKAYWIAMPGEDLTKYGVYEYQKTLTLAAKPEKFVVNVSADNRYKLFVNGELTSLGPSLGDLEHWFYQTVDIAPYLKEGENDVRAIVWNDGEKRAVHQFSMQTGFIMSGADNESAKFKTDPTWKVRRLNRYHQLEQHVIGFFPLNPGELIDMSVADSKWVNAIAINAGMLKGCKDNFDEHQLMQTMIPELVVKEEQLGDKAWKTITIPANTTKRIILDNKVLTNAFFKMVTTGGKGAHVAIRYAEGLYNNVGEKGNRNETEGKKFVARHDSLILDGSNYTFTNLDWRTYRYVGIDVTTGAEPLTIADVKSLTVRYPFDKTSTATCSDKQMEKMLEIGWRTATLCAMETYMDCPYYEQLQYVGDTRIQAMVTHFNTIDDRMPKKAIKMVDASRNTDGLTQSRYPSYRLSVIPPFSLAWIGMVYDYYRYRNDMGFVKQQLNGIRQVIHFFELYQEADGRLKNLPYWLFTDWAENCGRNWIQGAPVSDKKGYNGVVDLQLLWAYQMAAEIEAGIGNAFMAKRHSEKTELLKTAIRKNYYDAERGLLADNGLKKAYSQQANSLAILTGVFEGEEATAVAKKMVEEKDNLIQSSIYFLYYTNWALRKAGLGNDYISGLDIWRKNIALGMTTWGEDSKVESTRSDCHAWGASPNIEYYRTILGIESDAPGFAAIKIEPHLGTLTQASGSMPHPNGMISASYKQKGKKWLVEITIPENTKAYFIWNGEKMELVSGKNSFTLQ